MQSGPRRTVLAIAQAMFDSERAEVVADEAIAFARASSLPSRVTLRFALLALRFAPIVLFFSWRPLDRLDPDARRRVLARIEGTALGLALVAWRTLLVLHFYEDARELASVGYSSERRRHLVVMPVVPVPAESGVRLRDDVDDDELVEEKGAA